MVVCHRKKAWQRSATGAGKINKSTETGGAQMMRDVLLVGGGVMAMLGVAALIMCQSVHWLAFGWPVVR